MLIGFGCTTLLTIALTRGFQCAKETAVGLQLSFAYPGRDDRR